jgi:ATP-dependent helicase/nuclease subunit A
MTGQVVREFKFSILENATAYDPALEDEQILLQGVVDCALIEPDGITVVDFKTDYVTEETLPGVADRYRPQVQAYAQAMERIYQRPLKQALLYFFHMDRFVAL